MTFLEYTGIVNMSLTFGCFLFLASNEDGVKEKIKTEYQLEILNQDSVKVESLSTGRIYVVPFDEGGNSFIKR